MKYVQRKSSIEEHMRQDFIRKLKAMGINDVGGNGLHNLDYQELKWHLALQMAKEEV